MLKKPTYPNRVNQAKILTLAVFLSMGSVPGFAGQASSQFNVTVTLIPAPIQPTAVTPPVVADVVSSMVVPGLPVSAFCTKNNLPTAHGAVVTVVCSTGAVVDIEPGSQAGHPYTPMHGGSYRYVTHVAPNGTLADTVDAFGGAGTTTAWRLVKSSYRDYLEMTLGW